MADRGEPTELVTIPRAAHQRCSRLHMIIEYAQVSTLDQNLDLQMQALRKAGCKNIFREKVSGA